MRISDLSSDVCSSDLLASFLGEPLDAVELDLLAIVGADPTREVPEDLVGLGALVAPRQLSVLVVGGVEHDIELPAGVDDGPGRHRRVPVVAPVAHVVEIGVETVYADELIGVARTLVPSDAAL